VKRLILISVVTSACLSLCGCGDGLPKRVQVTGRVIFQDKPLHVGTITFSPKQKGATRPSLAYLREDGTFKMTTFRAGDGVQPGEYNVAIIAYDDTDKQSTADEDSQSVYDNVDPRKNLANWSRQGEKLIPEKYFAHATSGLQATIPNHDVELEFKIE